MTTVSQNDPFRGPNGLLLQFISTIRTGALPLMKDRNKVQYKSLPVSSHASDIIALWRETQSAAPLHCGAGNHL